MWGGRIGHAGYVLCKSKDGLLQLKKQSAASWEQHVLLQRALARWFPGAVSVPQILRVPASDVRALDAQILASRHNLFKPVALFQDKPSKGWSQASAFLALYMVLGRPF